MSGWNYRLFQHDTDSTDGWGIEIVEAYYDDNGKVYGHCTATLAQESTEELLEDMESMASAFAKPVLTRADITGTLDTDDEDGLADVMGGLLPISIIDEEDTA